MKKLIVLFAVILSGCDTSPPPRSNVYDAIDVRTERYYIVCIDYVQYIQSSSTGNLTPKYGQGSNTPASCTNKPEASK